MNNKYLSGLLAGVLTAGVLQGSDGKENMPGLGGNQTPMTRAQSTNELPEELQELFLAFSQSLAEMGYQAQVNVNPIQMPNQITRITLGENSGMQSNEGVVDLPEMVLSKPEIPSTPAELTQLTIGENGEIRQKVVAGEKQLDPYSMLQVARYMDAESIKKVQEVNSKFATEPYSRKIEGYGKLFNQLRMNPSPITAENHKLYSRIETQQIFGPSDYILPGMYQYIITYPVTKAEIETWVAQLGNEHNGKAIQENGEKPIVFEYQLLPNLWDKNANELQNEIITETEDFKIKQYYTDVYTTQARFSQDGNFRGRRLLNSLDKPIVFKEICNISVHDKQNSLLTDTFFDSQKHKAKMYQFNDCAYEEYVGVCQKWQDKNISFFAVTLEEQSPKEIKILSEDKRVLRFGAPYWNSQATSLAFLGNIKRTYGSISVDLNLLQKPRSIVFGGLDSGMQLGNRKIYNFSFFEYNNDIVSEKVKEYVQYVKDNNLEYLSGFVNFAKKPNYLTDEEWRKVMVLTGMVEELMNFVDQKFNEYEANPYAAPAADPYGCGDNYGCDGYGCAGYNPYGRFYYGYGCGYGC